MKLWVVSFMRQEFIWRIRSSCFSCELFYCLPNWQRLSTEFTVKWSNSTLIVLERCSCSPYTPIMYITSSLKPTISDSFYWRRRNIWNVKWLGLNDTWDELFEKFAIILSVFWLSPSPTLNTLENFIISSP